MKHRSNSPNLTLLALFALCFFVCESAAQDLRPNFNRIRTYDVQNYTIRVSFDRALKKIYGETTVSLKPLADNFRQIELDAAQLEFDAVTLDSSGANLAYKLYGEKVLISLDKDYSPADTVSVRLKYTAYPSKGVYFINEQRFKGEVVHSAQIWTQGEPEEAHHWFPSYDFPDDKATSEEFLTVETGETAVGNGELLEIVDNLNGTKTYHYKMLVPHSTYLVSFIVGKYAKVSDSYKNIPLGFYVYPGDETLAAAFGKTKDIIEVFEELTGIKFPFNKYEQIIAANFKQFDAMENITATTVSDEEFFNARKNSGKKDFEDTIAHELAHSWFGNLATCKNWSELWLNEGFATYMEAAYRERAYGRKEYERKIKEQLEEFLTDDSKEPVHSLYNLAARPDNSIFDSTSYEKGSIVIYTLRETIGDEAFWKGVNLYLDAHKFANVETADLQKAMEQSSGQKLDWFFAEWVYSTGYPNIEVTPAYNSSRKTLTLTFDQTQKSDNSITKAFTMPLEVEIKTRKGTRTEKILLNQMAQSFTFESMNEPKKIEVDKNTKIPLKTVKVNNLKTLEN
jgi:aminopeptidase N